MQEVRAIIEKVAPTEANVLLLGENGTGKELVAKSLHEQSRRAARPFVAADVAALARAVEVVLARVDGAHVPPGD
jgi:DNA-binding NtrC family response regulator